MNHTFNVLFAQKYGMDEAVFIQTLVLWTATNAAHGEENNIHFQEGRYWSFGTPEYFCKFFPYWKPRGIKYIIKNCINLGLIVKGVFNKKRYDRTNWYSLSDNALLELNLDKTCLKPAPELIIPILSNALDRFCPMDQTDFVQPIPITKPITKNINNSASADAQKINYNKFDKNNPNEKSDYQGNQQEEMNVAQETLVEKETDTRSDYFENQLKNKSNSKSFGLNDLLEDNPHQIPEQMIQDWITTRKSKRLGINKTSWRHINIVLQKLKEKGIDPIEAFERMVANGWHGIEMKYFEKESKVVTSINQSLKNETHEEKVARWRLEKERNLKRG